MSIGKSSTEIMWDMILNTVKKEALVNYTIVESYDFGNSVIQEISRLKVNASSIKEAKLFADNNRRAHNSLLLIRVNKTIIAEKAGVMGKWESKYLR